jgi:hypothetical protein
MAYATADALGSFTVGDIPLKPVVLTVFDDEGYPQDLDGLTASGTLNGVPLAVTVEDDHLKATLPQLNVEGVNRLTVKLGGQAMAALRFVVEGPTDWLTIEDARDQWRDAPVSDVELYELLEASRVQCVAFAPSQAVGVPVPIHFRRAQLLQARNSWNAGKVDPSGQVGADGFQITIFPMDWAVKALLRPKVGKPVIG